MVVALVVVALELVEEAALVQAELLEAALLEVVGAALDGRFAFVVLLQPDLASLQFALMVQVEEVAPAT